MAFPNISDIVATTIENRSRQIADNVTKNNGLLRRLQQGGRVKPFSGGTKILQELSFAENSNAGFYSGYDILPVGIADVISAAEYEIRQAAVPCIISGLEMLQNSGREQIIDLLESRMEVVESTMSNLLATSVYSDGTGFGGKEVDGLDAAVPLDPSSGQYGGIDRAQWAFWRNATVDSSDSDNLLADMNLLWSKLVRGTDRPDLIVMDNEVWMAYVAKLQAQQQFLKPDVGEFGFPTLKFMGTDVILDGGIGGACPPGTAFFLNSRYIKWRPHRSRNMVPLSPNRRYAVNQDAEVQILAWAGNLTCSGAQFQGRLDINP